MSEVFGGERHQATVSGTLTTEQYPLLEAVLIGFTWTGPAGQESEIRFEAEAIFDPERKRVADQLAAEVLRQQAEDVGQAEEPGSSDEPPDAFPEAIDEADEPGGGGLPAPILIGGLAAFVAAAFFLFRRLRAR
ncbi:MAG: hypothetical protein HKN80_12930 [Acidimicrobiia bacterium]|nr:hypothetical protein [Acidimicrobiia bacterium]